MATTNKNRRFGSEWGSCGTCGRAFPVFKLRRHPRFGVQCLPDCWDGGPHRDELDPPIHADEGTRRSDFPVVDPDAGLDD